MYRPQNINYLRQNINYSRQNTSSNKIKIIFILCLITFVVIVILFYKKNNDSKQIPVLVQVPVPVPVPVSVSETNMQNTEQEQEQESALFEHIIKDDDIKILEEHSIILPDTSKIISNGDYTIINAIVRDYTYYRLGVKTELEFNNTLYIQSIINSIILMIKDNNIKNNLEREKPIFLIGSNAHDFLELQSLKDIKSSEGGRNVLNVYGFGPVKPIPGFLSNIFNKCNDPYFNDNIVFHEFMHAIHFYGLIQKQQDVLNELYNKYKVLSNIYDIKSYVFVNVYEFFAEMAQVYCQMTFRLDATGGIIHKILKENLPDMYIFLKSIFDIDQNHVLNAICKKCKENLLCCRDEYEECTYWESIGECNNIKTHCRKSCKICQ